MYNLKERIAILIDYHNFWTPQNLPDLQFWNNLNAWLIRHFVDRAGVTREDIMHMGTWMFVQLDHSREMRDKFQRIDNLHGYIIRYSLLEGDQKGIDVHLVCQMLMGAFEDRYDSCILFSDDMEFEPAVHAVQNMYGKRVFHAGFERDRLCAACFGNFALDQIDGVSNIDDLVQIVAS